MTQFTQGKFSRSRLNSRNTRTPHSAEDPQTSSHGRTRFVIIILDFLFLCIIGRLFYWQVLHRGDLQAEAQAQYTRVVPVTAHRGQIFTSDGYLLVGNQKVYRLFAEPNVLQETPAMIANTLAPLLAADQLASVSGVPAPTSQPVATPVPTVTSAKSALASLPSPTATPSAGFQMSPNIRDVPITDPHQIENLRNDLQAKLSDPKVHWIALRNRITDNTKQKIDALKIHGLGFDSYDIRAYPEASMAAEITGFVGKDKNGNDQGYFGVEGALDRELRGHTEQKTFLKDALGFRLLFDQQSQQNQQDGRDVVLSIRRDVQYMVEDELQKGIEKYGASAGEAIVMDPKTGQIIAMAGFPSYEQAHFQDFDPSLYKNPSITDTYEPGSIFKVLTVSAGIDTGVITPDTQCPKCASARQIGQYSIKTWNDQYHPDITMNDALAKSDNVAMVYISDLLGTDHFLDYIHRFGIGDPLQIDLQEDTGTPFRKDWKPIDLATSSFGQGIVTNGLQMVRAVGAVANGGVMMRPTIVSKVIDSAQNSSVDVKPVVERQVISPETAAEVTKMMVYAADTGEAKWTASKTHLVAAKTGTAQVPISGHYDPTQTIASFIGFSPPDDPKFVMLVKLRAPTKSPWAAETAAPLWYSIADRLFILLNVPADR